MSTIAPEGTGTTKKNSSRVITIIVAVAAVAVAAAVLFFMLRPDGPGAGSAAPSATPSATEAGPAAAETTAPAAPAPEEPAPQELVSFTTADGMLQFDHPAGWTVQPLSSPSKDQFNQTGEALEVVNADGQTMGELITGLAVGFVSVPGVPYFEFEYEPLTGLADKDPGRGEAPAFVFHGLDQVAGFEAQMAITGSGRETGRESSVLRHGFEFVPGASGAFFNRPIGPGTVLPVDPALTGAARMEAYMQTEEYKDIKAMMMSTRFLQ